MRALTRIAVLVILSISCTCGQDEDLLGLPEYDIFGLDTDDIFFNYKEKDQVDSNAVPEPLKKLCQEYDLEIDDKKLDCQSIRAIPKTLQTEEHVIQKREAEEAPLEGSGEPDLEPAIEAEKLSDEAPQSESEDVPPPISEDVPPPPPEDVPPPPSEDVPPPPSEDVPPPPSEDVPPPPSEDVPPPPSEDVPPPPSEDVPPSPPEEPTGEEAPAPFGADILPEEPAAEAPAPEEPAAEAPAPEEPAAEAPAPEEAAPEAPAPEEAAPEAPAPEEAAPEAAPEAPAPEEAAPEAPAPEEAAPEAPAPEEPAPEEAAPEAPAPEEAVPEAPAPEEATPEAPAPEEPAPEAPAPEAPAPEAPAEGEDKTDDAQPPVDEAAKVEGTQPSEAPPKEEPAGQEAVPAPNAAEEPPAAENGAATESSVEKQETLLPVIKKGRVLKPGDTQEAKESEANGGGSGTETLHEHQSGNALIDAPGTDTLEGSDAAVKKMSSSANIEEPSKTDLPKSGESSEDTKQGRKDSKILIILLVAVVVIGCAAFAYNFIKKRKQKKSETSRTENGNATVQNKDAEHGTELKPLMKGTDDKSMVEYKDEKDKPKTVAAK